MWVDGNPNGQGRRTCRNGDFFEGVWGEGGINGAGKRIYGDGEIYEGNFIQG
jgi:hypothetical protein